jgi:antitoxin CptB
MQPAPDVMDARAAGGHQDDPARRRRLRWRARRGLLENDILLTRFLDRHESSLTDADVAGLDRLLDLTDNELMDLILGRREPEGTPDDEDARRVLARLRLA